AVVAVAILAGLIWVSASTRRLDGAARMVGRVQASVARALRSQPPDDAGLFGLDRPDGVSLGLRGWSGLFALAEVNWLADIAALALALAAVGGGVASGRLRRA